MNVSFVCDLPPVPDNPRNSEGAFMRGKKGEILFAYSRYTGESNHDRASCDIALIRSFDEGNTWSVPRIIARAKEDYGTQNIMSVSAMPLKNGDLAFYFLINENDYTTTLGRCVSSDGEHFVCERCGADFPPAFYVVNNDRLVRLSDGRIAAPAAWISAADNAAENRVEYVATCLISEDDGASFYKAEFGFVSSDKANSRYGYQEPGIIELKDKLYYWIRTGYGRQYESVSTAGINGFCTPYPSVFTSPPSPLQIKKYDGALYAVYNPVPRANGYEERENPGTWGRTPFVIRKSVDEGETWGPLNIIEDDPTRGYCYPALFKTNDGELLLAYCRGDAADGTTLCRLGIAKVDLSSVE